ncbi:hypothetical protein THAOC_27799, partial [Thalassiosira oceanica]
AVEVDRAPALGGVGPVQVKGLPQPASFPVGAGIVRRERAVAKWDISALNREYPHTGFAPVWTGAAISRAVDGRFASFQACQPRRHIPRDDRAEVRRGDVEGQYAPFQVHNIKEHDVCEPCTNFRNSIL